MKLENHIYKKLIIVILILFFSFSLAGCKTKHNHSDDEKINPSEEKQTIYTCSMHPQIRQPGPGKCPICEMDLIPVATKEGASFREYEMSESAKRIAEIEVIPVEKKPVSVETRLVGKVDYDETKLATITAYFPGRIDRLWIDYTGVSVNAGHKMATIYSPEILSTQQELLQAFKAVKDSENSNIEEVKKTAERNLNAVREKMRLWGLTADQIKEIENRGTPADTITINSPLSGIVIKKDAIEGMYVETGMPIFTIADLSRIWIKLDAYESDLKFLRPAQDVAFTAEAYPGEVFKGKIAFIDPMVNPMTRTIKIRVNVENKDGRLKPEMFVRAIVNSNISANGKVINTSLAGKWICPMHIEVMKDHPDMCDICDMPLSLAEDLGYVSSVQEAEAIPLVIPASAPLITGKRAIVYVQVSESEKPVFEGREVVLGPKAGSYYIVRSGLAEGELVVTKGAFKIDSALQLEAKPSMMSPEGGISIGEHHHGTMAKVKSDNGKVEQSISIPASFIKHIKKIEEALSEISSAISKNNIEDSRSAFSLLEKEISSIDKNVVPENALLIWNELSMLMINDAIEGKEAIDIDDAKRIALKAKSRLEKLKGAFGIVTETPVKRLDVPLEFKAQLNKVFDAYIFLSESLASDDGTKASEALLKISQELESVDMSLLKNDAHLKWMSESAKLKKTLSNVKSVDDITGIRKNFALISDEFAFILNIFGAPSEGNVYRIKCPMAFNNRGATWLQKDDDIRNPYFGASMYKCGEVIEEISSDSNGEQK